MSRYLHLFVFFAGLAAVCWIGAGYVSSNPLALAVTMLIGACYLAGALELQRYSQATSTLALAFDAQASARRCRGRPSRRIWSACWCCWACSARCWAWWRP